ncbi:MAG: O-antigen ligase family protein [Prolixibacteraceae bacterium]|nr:O-antigen ligase family protein [Prolixibacteraceae bacterium]
MEEYPQNKTLIPESWLKYILFYLISIAFIGFNAILFLEKDSLLGVAIPVAFIIVLTAVFAYDKLIWLAVLLTPVSVPLSRLVYGLPFDLHMPTEPLLFGLLLLFLISQAAGNRIDKKITRHPIAIAVYFYLFWMAFTSVTSTLPLVSLKYWLTRIWFTVVFLFLLAFLFQKQKNIERFILFFTIAFVPIIIYTLARHMKIGFYNDTAAHWVMTPFFNDHTSYGAVLAMFIPFLAGFAFGGWIKKKYRFWLFALLGIFVVAEIMSFSRAAWLSLILAGGIWVLIKLKVKFKHLIITIATFLLIVFSFQQQILERLERNSQDSSSNLTEHFTSMTNITTDASNLERINRWQCAIAMFKEKPVLGWGPGTYSFNYAPFQLTRQRTIISTNSGDGGNAHSEYLGALAESGIIGSLSFIIIIIVVLYTGIKAYSATDDKRIKTLLLSAVLGLITYYSHGILNNFLDTDKASVPFWGFTAIIVALDIYIKQTNKEKGKAIT